MTKISPTHHVITKGERRGSIQKNPTKRTSLKDQIKRAFPQMTEKDFDRHETDLYVKYTPELRDWLKKNYDFYSSITTFRSQIGNGELWFDIPFAAWEAKYG